MPEIDLHFKITVFVHFQIILDFKTTLISRVPKEVYTLLLERFSCRTTGMLLVCVKIFKYHYRIFLQRSRGMPWFVHLSKLCYLIIVKGDWRWNGYLFLCGKLLWFILSYFKLSETSLKKDWKKSKERMCRNFQFTISSHQIRVGLFSERRKTKELLRRSLVRELTCANA